MGDDELAGRPRVELPHVDEWVGTGRELFDVFRRGVGGAAAGASVISPVAPVQVASQTASATPVAGATAGVDR